ncbi:MAG: class I SAM-dependent methyltransferase [Acidobacteriota bacterium]
MEKSAASVGVTPDPSSPIDRLMRARARHGETWGTLDAETLREFERIFEEVGGRGRKILEIGSGNGFNCVLFGLLGAAEVRGVEVVPEAVAIAEAVRTEVDPGLPVSFQLGDAGQPLPFPDASFDALLLIEVISHVVTPDVSGFLREMARVVRPGGILYIQDGNNARSWKRRRENYEIWRRFENGPITEGGETVHSHRVGKPYVELRADIARAAEPALSAEDARRIAERTFRFDAARVREAAREFRETGRLPHSPFQEKTCPIEPISRSYIEELVDPIDLMKDLRAFGCEILACRTRRKLPGDFLWRRLPFLTMRVANGFTVVARKLA